MATGDPMCGKCGRYSNICGCSLSTQANPYIYTQYSFTPDPVQPELRQLQDRVTKLETKLEEILELLRKQVPVKRKKSK